MALSATFTKLIQASVATLRPVITNLYDSFHSAYVSAGAPYGGTSEAMARWYREAIAAQAAKERIYQERLRQWCSDDFARQIRHPETPALPVPQRDD